MKNKQSLIAVGGLLAVALVVVIRNYRAGDAVSPRAANGVVEERVPVPSRGKINPMPRLPAPRFKARQRPAVPAQAPETPELSREMLEKHLTDTRRSVASLLAVSRITKDLALLDEAKRKDPGNPQVLLDWILRSAATPEEKKQALDEFRKAVPDNAVGDYLFALQQFEAGDVDGAVTALWQASQQPAADAYFMNALRDAEEAYIGAGYPPLQALMEAAMGMENHVLGRFRQLSDWTLDMQAAYAADGDAESARTIALTGSGMGAAMLRQFEHGTVVDQVSAINYERKFLELLDPAVELVAGGPTAGARLDELNALRDQIKSALEATVLRDHLDESAMMEYYQQVKLKGEVGALLGLQQMKKP
ncbi:MAG: hypothetical protein NTW21_29120 [Verrucomicrobia bacterium]|nr:hypothetical protein [Verrucomicrobiota bacterium]